MDVRFHAMSSAPSIRPSRQVKWGLAKVDQLLTLTMEAYN